METFLPPMLQDTSLVKALQNAYSSFCDRRASLGLSNPGSVENIAREVQKDVFLSNGMFTGLRADFTRPMSITPLFQYSHAFAMGSQGIPPYNFSALYGTQQVRKSARRFVTCFANARTRCSSKAISTTMDS